MTFRVAAMASSTLERMAAIFRCSGRGGRGTSQAKKSLIEMFSNPLLLAVEVITLPN
jgi:hypothetical protein